MKQELRDTDTVTCRNGIIRTWGCSNKKDYTEELKYEADHSLDIVKVERPTRLETIYEETEVLPFGVWLQNTTDTNCFAVFKDKKHAFGQVGVGCWADLIDGWDDLDSDNWEIADKENVDEMLIEYAKTKGYKPGNHRCLESDQIENGIIEGKFFLDSFGELWVDGEIVRSKVFDAETGKWADIIENNELEQAFATIRRLTGAENITLDINK